MKSLFQQIKKLKKRTSIIKKYTSFLRNGHYIGDSQGKAFWLKESTVDLRFCTEHLKRKVPASPIRRKLLRVTIKSKEKFFDGEIAVLGNTAENDIPASVKLFNLRQEEVVTVYLDEKKMLCDVNAYQYFQDKFPLVPILSQDLDKKIIKEKLIVSKATGALGEEEYRSLFARVVAIYGKYFKNEPNDKIITLGELFREATENGFPSFLEQPISSKLQSFAEHKLPLKILHGDFTYSNLLFNQDSCYFIDFEHFGDFCFYYDIFWLMQNEYVYGQNKTLLNAYFNGALDSEFQFLFASVGEQFDSSLRNLYYVAFVLEMYNKRICNSNAKGDSLRYLQTIFDEFHLGVNSNK